MTAMTLEGDALMVLKTLPDKIVQTCITSPPYWGLRSYKTEPQVWGGREDCEHEWGQLHASGINYIQGNPEYARPHREKKSFSAESVFCSLCGAWRGELGLEPTPELYIQHIVEIFHELRRILRDDGTLWLNMGDSYAGSGKGAWDNKDGGQKEVYIPDSDSPQTAIPKVPSGLKPKDLCGIPWRVAMALQADGWWLRSDIIWNKPNPMPESVTDRPTRSHEYIFLLSKKARYYYDAEAVREPNIDPLRTNYRPGKEAYTEGNVHDDSGRKRRNEGFQAYAEGKICSGRNLRTVWTFATQPFPEAHFATFPEELVRRCILAGTAEQACPTCGAAWERIISTEYIPHGESAKSGGDYAGDRNSGDLTHGKFRPQEMKYGRATRKDTTLGFRPTCKCENNDGSGRCIALDPFGGSGTVALIALKHGRDHLTIELKPEYIKMIMKRLKPLGNRPCPQQVEII